VSTDSAAGKNDWYDATMIRTVTVVDEKNHALGTEEIIKAHTGTGTLHRAFSVYVFNPEKTSLLIQQRSRKKMLWPNIWANTCCSHPFEGETAIAAGKRRLTEELGFSCELQEGRAFVYRAEDATRGVEHEHVTILIGSAGNDIAVKPDPDEVAEWKWTTVSALLKAFDSHPDIYAPWLKIGLMNILASGNARS
jgi:isopentenyl-diphosphate delta-isomerase